MNNFNLNEAVLAIAEEKNINKDIIYDAIKDSIEKIYAKKYDADAIITTDINKQTGKITIYKELVDFSEADFKKAQAAGSKKIIIQNDKYYEIINSQAFNRLAITMAAQIIKQQIRAAEKDAIMKEYLPSKGEIMYGEVAQSEPNYILVKFNKTYANIPRIKLINNEEFYIGDPITFLAEDITNDKNYAQIQGTRTSNDFLVKLMELEIPEILEEAVIIKGAVRNPGFRSKVTVAPFVPESNIDPVGACIGPRGTRINAISSQLNGEKIDVCLWDSDLKTYIMNVESPVKVIEILLNPITVQRESYNDVGVLEIHDIELNNVYIVVPDEQYLLSIGFKGKYRRLVSHLTHSSISIISYRQALEAGVQISWNGNITPEELTKLQERLQRIHCDFDINNPKAIEMMRLQRDFNVTDQSENNDQDVKSDITEGS